ncbi:hypothetical protein DAERI_060201 [Deinococcus aerius]|uniref:Uncharacterized protein n=1 Tax=Deinococcus aerius TaxID=200253 RepID=A0A2I9DLT1_9DEIO|nr:hypothetical protein DAERI_060201 [Deinococcus aerius]
MTDPHETDRLSDPLDEPRILLQGAQVLTSFLIILPFNTEFSGVLASERWVYAATFLCSLTSLLLSAPALHHSLRRPVSHPRQFKETVTRLVQAGAVFMCWRPGWWRATSCPARSAGSPREESPCCWGCGGPFPCGTSTGSTGGAGARAGRGNPVVLSEREASPAPSPCSG